MHLVRVGGEMRGAIVKRGKSWSYVLYLGRDQDGKKRQKWVGGFRTRRDAEEALTQSLDRVRTGTWADPGRITVAEYLEQWLDGIRPSLRPKTTASYEDALRGWVIPRVGSVRLVGLTAPRLRALYGELLESGRRNGSGGLSPRSVQYAHRIVSHALKDAVDHGLLVRNPASLVKPPRVPKPPMRVWSADEARRFLTAVADDRLCALWTLLLTTGLRRGEVLGLRWEDVDLKRGRLAVRQTVVAIGYDVDVSEPKTTTGRRSVSLDPTTVAALKAHRRRQAEELLRAELGAGESELVFTTEDGSMIHPDRISKVFAQLIEQHELPTIRLHDLRHTAATLALTAGVHPKVVQERLGHANITITLDTYSHVLQGLQEDAAAKVAELVFKDA
jgi:integrase